MITQSPTQQAKRTPRSGLRFSVRDVTGTHSASVELDPDLRVGTVAETVAARLSLPNDTAWALRDESTAAFLDDEAAIGDAVRSDSDTEPALVVTPKAHLG
jgi:hypothetical protein